MHEVLYCITLFYINLENVPRTIGVIQPLVLLVLIHISRSTLSIIVNFVMVANRKDYKFKKIDRKSQVLDIAIDGIQVGDLIYDTYMKSFRKAEVEVKTFKLFLIILLAYIAMASQKKFFHANKFHELYLSHSVYLSYGILGRLALKEKIDV